MQAGNHFFLSNTGAETPVRGPGDHPQPVPCTLYPAQLSTCVSATALFSLKVLHSEVLRYTETGNSLSTFTLM